MRRSGKRNGEEDEDERKPPARILVPSQKTPVRLKESEESPSNITASGETSLASSYTTTTSAVAPTWTSSPVARAVPRNDTTKSDTPSRSRLFTPPPPRKKTTTAAAAAPSLTAATPFSPYHAAADDNSSVDCKKPAVITELANSASNNAEAATLANLWTHLLLWSATVAVGVAVFLYQILPLAAMYTLLFILASLGMLTQTVLSDVRRLFRQISNQGLQNVLPASVFELLTVTSVHDWMTDPAFMLEYRHLLLYFLPLSEDQLNQSIARLAPQHIDRLYRPGLGHYLLGENTMRLILGQERYQQEQQQEEFIQNHHRSSAIIEQVVDEESIEEEEQVDPSNTPAPPRQRMLLFDDDDSDCYSGDSDLGLNVTANDLAGGLNEAQAVSVAARLGLENTTSAVEEAAPVRTPVPPSSSRTPPVRTPVPRSMSRTPVRTPAVRTPALPTGEVDENAYYADQELQVLTDALTDSFYGSIYNPIQNYFSSSIVVPTVTTISSFWARFSAIVALSATGFGIWGFWSGIYTFPTFASLTSSFTATTRGSRTNYPPSWTVWTTALVGGTSVGLALYTRRYVRQSSTDDNTSNSGDEGGGTASDAKTPQKAKKNGE